MIWLVRFYLFFMGITYLLIGLWAILDLLFTSMEISAPSFLDAVGLSITSEIGYSEIAGLYGGLNIGIGLMCLVGIAKETIGIFSIKFLTFLAGSIASGRILFSLLPSSPTFFNSFFVFEICAVAIGLCFLKVLSGTKSDY